MKWIKDRFPILVVMIILAAAYAALVLSGQGYQGQNAAPEYTPMPQSVASGSVGQNVEGITPENDKGSHQDKEKRDFEIADHKAQVRMANYAKIGVGLGVFGSILLFFTLRYTRDAAEAATKTLGQAKIATEEAKRSADAAWNAQRPWIEIAITCTEDIADQNTDITKVIVKNIGKSPAVDIVFISETRPKISPEPSRGEMDDFVRRQIAEYRNKFELSFFLSPNEVSDMRRNLFLRPNPNERMDMIGKYIGAIYRTPGSSNIYYIFFFRNFWDENGVLKHGGGYDSVRIN